MKINIFFSFEILKKIDKSPPFVSSSFQTEGSESNFFRDIREKLNSLESIKYTIKTDFNILKINSLFSLEILKKVDKGPPLLSSSLQTKGWKSNFFRDISAKENALDSL